MMAGMVKEVHRYDVKFGIQLAQYRDRTSSTETLGPSAVPSLTGGKDATARAMTKDEIRELVKAFGNAAKRCVKAGFDFLEINTAFMYLLGEFLTPYYNRRTDEYGGSFHNRIRFLIEVIREMKQKVSAVYLDLPKRPHSNP